MQLFPIPEDLDHIFKPARKLRWTLLLTVYVCETIHPMRRVKTIVMCRPLPFYVQIHGRTAFKFTLREMKKLVEDLTGAQLAVRVTVLHWRVLEEMESSALAWVYSNKPNIKFLGGRTRTFKPHQPMDVYVNKNLVDSNASLNHIDITLYCHIYTIICGTL